MSNPAAAATWQTSGDSSNGLRRIESNWMGGNGNSSQDVAFAIPDFSDFDIPSDFFSMLPELEPISANVGAGFDIDLDKPWY